MKIYLYNKYFSTLGGGEKDSCGIAEVLSKKYDVSILYVGNVDIEMAQKKLNLDLSRVNFISFNDVYNFEQVILSFVDKNKPDIFINATYFSSLLSSAPINVTRVFFPKFNPPWLSPPKKYSKLKYKIGQFLFSKYDEIVRFYEGFGDEEYLNNIAGRWSFENSTLFINKKFTFINIYFNFFRPEVIPNLIKGIAIHGNNLNYEIHKKKLRLEFNSNESVGIHLKFNSWKPSKYDNLSKDDRELGLFITSVDTDALSILSRLVLKFWRTDLFKNKFTNLYSNWRKIQDYNYLYEFHKKSYNLPNSNYTEKWLKKIYGTKEIKSTMIFPPVDVENFYSSEHKKNIILCVGRFFVGGHNKKQIDMIKIFKKMYDQYPSINNYEMHLCGGTHPEEHHQEYKKLCELSAQGYPIKFHFDIKYPDLLKIYSEANLFWHGSGMNENEDKDPDKFEHFGITTVEAMASGCVPIVIGVAGQIEIVQNEENGFLWKTEEEIISQTLKLVNNPELIKTISKKSILAAQKFNKSFFDKSVDSFFLDLINDLKKQNNLTYKLYN